MKIAFFTDAFYPHVDGVATYIATITKGLIANGHEVLIVAPKWGNTSIAMVQKSVPGAKITLAPGVKFIFYPEFYLATASPFVLLEIRKFAPEIIHFHTPAFLGMQAILLAKMLRLPLVTTFHTYYMEPEGFAAIGIKSKGKVADLLQESLWKMSERVYNPCDVVIAPTTYVGKDLQKRWKKAAIKVIPGAVDTLPFANHEQRKTLRNKYNLGDCTVFLSVGRLSPEKNHEMIITAFSMMLMKYPNSKLVFIGEGKSRQGLEYLAKVLGISDAVIFVGKVPYQMLVNKNYYAMGDVFVTASTWDTQGLSVVEAMAAGLPVVAQKYRAMPEVVGKGGILTRLGDPRDFARAMAGLVANKKKRLEVGKLAQQEAQKYQVEKHLKDLVALYQEII